MLELLAKDVLRIDFHMRSEVEPLQVLMRKFASVPMSLADACLVRMAELHVESKIITLDADFRVYRRNRRHVIPTVMPSDG